MCLCNLDTFFMVLVHWIFHKMWPYSIKIKNKYNNIFWLFSLIMSFVLGWWTWVRIMPTQKWNQVVSWLDIIKQSLWIVCHKFSNIIVTIYLKNKCRTKKIKNKRWILCPMNCELKFSGSTICICIDEQQIFRQGPNTLLSLKK